uniref:Uncharacterized protein n=1 Tax=Heterosigma akashiwo TaxID=2829 RepID=A0A7S4DBC0_HETAK
MSKRGILRYFHGSSSEDETTPALKTDASTMVPDPPLKRTKHVHLRLPPHGDIQPQEEHDLKPRNLLKPFDRVWNEQWTLNSDNKENIPPPTPKDHCVLTDFEVTLERPTFMVPPSLVVTASNAVPSQTTLNPELINRLFLNRDGGDYTLQIHHGLGKIAFYVRNQWRRNLSYKDMAKQLVNLGIFTVLKREPFHNMVDAQILNNLTDQAPEMKDYKVSLANVDAAIKTSMYWRDVAMAHANSIISAVDDANKQGVQSDGVPSEWYNADLYVDLKKELSQLDDELTRLYDDKTTIIGKMHKAAAEAMTYMAATVLKEVRRRLCA